MSACERSVVDFDEAALLENSGASKEIDTFCFIYSSNRHDFVEFSW
jgi:hypothetical protein